MKQWSKQSRQQPSLRLSRRPAQLVEQLEQQSLLQLWATTEGEILAGEVRAGAEADDAAAADPGPGAGGGP